MHKFTFMLLAIFSAPLFADLGHVNLIMTGTVLQESCDISADTKNQTVTIGSFSSAEFKSVGSVTTAVPFTIQLNKCSPNISTAGVTFNGTQFGSDPTQLALTDTSGSGDLAVGVVVQVLDNNGPIALNSVNGTRYTLHAGDKNKLPFSLRYQATQIPVKPGNGSAVLYFSMDYQ